MFTILSKKQFLLWLITLLTAFIATNPTNAKAHSASASLYSAAPAEFEVGSQIHSYTRLRSVAGPTISANIAIRPDPGFQVTGFDLSYELIHDQPYNVVLDTKHETHQRGSNNNTPIIVRAVQTIYPVNKLNAYALALCDGNAVHLRSLGQTDEQIYGANHTIPIKIMMKIKASIAPENGDTSYFNSENISRNAFNIVCKTNSSAANDRLRDPRDPVEAVTIRIAPHPTQCKVTVQVRVTAKNRESNQDIHYKLRNGADNSLSRAYSIRTNSLGEAYKNHTISVNNGEQIAQGSYLVYGTQPRFTSNWARYSMDCSSSRGLGIDIKRKNISIPPRNNRNITPSTTPEIRRRTPLSTNAKTGLPDNTSGKAIKIPNQATIPKAKLKGSSK